MVVSFIGGIVLLTKLMLERQFVMPKYDDNNKISKSEPVKHLKRNPTKKFTWTIISKAYENFRKRRVLEAYFVNTICPTLNQQLDNDILILLRNGII